MIKHEYHQGANDWVMCKCGKVFGDSKVKKAMGKLQNHIKNYDRTK